LLFAGQSLHKGLLHRDERIATHQHEPRLGEVKRNDGNLFEMNVVPDVELSPIGKRENANAFVGPDAAIEEVPQLGALIFGIPLPCTVAKGENAFLGAGFLLIATRTAKSRIEVVVAQCIEQGLRLEQSAAALGA